MYFPRFIKICVRIKVKLTWGFAVSNIALYLQQLAAVIIDQKCQFVWWLVHTFVLLNLNCLWLLSHLSVEVDSCVTFPTLYVFYLQSCWNGARILASTWWWVYTVIVDTCSIQQCYSWLGHVEALRSGLFIDLYIQTCYLALLHISHIIGKQ